MSGPVVVWFRDDLRIHDNPALHAAAERGADVVCVYLHDIGSPGIRPYGTASRWWLHHSLAALDESLAQIGLRLTIRTGDALEAITSLADETGASVVLWNRRYDQPGQDVDERIRLRLIAEGIATETFAGSLLAEPGTVLTGSGEPHRVFTSFWKTLLALPAPRKPLRRPPPMRSADVSSDDLASLDLLPRDAERAARLARRWRPGEEQAAKRLRAFASSGLLHYGERRDVPGEAATSLLSPHLRWGELSPFQVWHATIASADFRRELGWREFAHHVDHFWSNLHRSSLRPVFDGFEWEDPGPLLDAWQRGETGVPLVDAGMRELLATGHIHNRIRMVAASYLVKNLLVDWRLGEEWFWDALVDADPASNPFNWQWVAGSGVDAAAYFRVFNPELQAGRYDPDQAYRRRWIPELGTPQYPDPLVDLGDSRHRALEEYRRVIRRADQTIRPPDAPAVAPD